MNLDEARKSRTRRVSEKGTAKKGNCARCHSFFFRSFSPSFSFSFSPLFFRLPFFLSLLRFTRVAGLRFPYNTVHVQPPRLRSEFACKLRAISFRQIWNHPTIYVCTRASGFDSVYRIGGERWKIIYEFRGVSKWSRLNGKWWQLLVACYHNFFLKKIYLENLLWF